MALFGVTKASAGGSSYNTVDALGVCSANNPVTLSNVNNGDMIILFGETTTSQSTSNITSSTGVRVIGNADSTQVGQNYGVCEVLEVTDSTIASFTSRIGAYYCKVTA